MIVKICSSENRLASDLPEKVTSPSRVSIFEGHFTDTGEDSKLVHRRKRPKVDTLLSTLFPTRPSDEYDSAPSPKYSRPLLDVFACIGLR